MNKIDLLKKLEEMIHSYITDAEVSNELIKNITPTQIKYILAGLESNKIKEYTLEDKEWIKDIYFYFC